MNDSFYSKSPNIKNDTRTFIPGMRKKDDPLPDAAMAPAVRLEFQQRPIAGILYSVSRDLQGEIFPVYIGRNTIGSSPESDIYLSEESVSPEHCLLLIRKLRLKDGSKRETMSISDIGSRFGIAINGRSLEEEVEPIKMGDIIRIGNAYNFIFIPLDSEDFGLHKSSNFNAIPRKENRPPVNTEFIAYMMPTAIGSVQSVDNTVYPNTVGEEDEQTFYGRTTRKKEDHSDKQTML